VFSADIFHYGSLDFAIGETTAGKMQPACFQRWIIYNLRVCVNDYFAQYQKQNGMGV